MGLVMWSSAWASPELVQIVTFGWEEDTRTLSAISLGSGTIIGPNLILTNKHVILKDKTQPADFILLCLSGTKSTHPVSCNIPAGVTAVHEKLDAALIRPVGGARVYFSEIQNPVQRLEKNDRVRIEGFPIPVKGITNFGGTQTIDNIKRWAKEGGELKTAGDALTITRGKVRGMGELRSTGGIYYMTDVKVNFGNSGGAAFDENRKFIGIPTLRDTSYNALILEYEQLKGWIQANKPKNPNVSEKLLRTYEAKVKKRTVPVATKRSPKKPRATRVPRRVTRRTRTPEKTTRASVSKQSQRKLPKRRSARRKYVTKKSAVTTTSKVAAPTRNQAWRRAYLRNRAKKR